MNRHLARFVAAIILSFLWSCASKPSPPQATQQTHSTQNISSNVARPKPSLDELLQSAAAKPSTPFEAEGWQSLFDGKNLTGWRETLFSGRGEVECKFGLIVLKMGDPFTGIGYTNEFPTMDYELAFDAMRLQGSDFFCGLTIPIGTNFCSLIVGGWGGSLVGISSLDSMDASENETTRFKDFEQQHWYRIRLRITHDRIEAWIEKEKFVDVVTAGKRISVRPGDIELSRPFGFSCWQSTAALREIKMRRVSEPADRPKRY